ELQTVFGIARAGSELLTDHPYLRGALEWAFQSSPAMKGHCYLERVTHHNLTAFGFGFEDKTSRFFQGGQNPVELRVELSGVFLTHNSVRGDRICRKNLGEVLLRLEHFFGGGCIIQFQGRVSCLE